MIHGCGDEINGVSGVNGEEEFSGVDFQGNTEDLNHGTPTFGSYGSPLNVETMSETIKHMKFTYIGTKTHVGHFVGERLGGNEGCNEGDNGQRSTLSRLVDIVNPATYRDAVRLFTDGSPHSSYKCSELPGARCGDRP